MSSSASTQEKIYDDEPRNRSVLGEKSLAEADEALEVVQDLEGQGVELDAKTNKRLRLRADLIIMPCVCFVYGVQYLDRTTLSYASVMNFQKDLHLTSNDYAWLSSIFFFGFLGAEFLTGRILQRFPIAKYLGISAILWGIISCCFAAAPSYGAAAALRFILGLLQACVSPALVIIVSQWYTKYEHSSRTSIWVSSSGFAQIIGGLSAYGISGRSPSDTPLALWKVVFIVFGVIAIFAGLLVLVVVPDSQRNAWWLSRQERALAVERVRVNQQGIGNRKFKWYQLRETFTDPFVWLILFYSVAANVPNGGLTNYFSLIIQSFGYNARQSLLYSTPAGAVIIVSVLGWGFLTRKTGNRILWAIFTLLICLVGAIMIVVIGKENPTGRLVGYYLTLALPASEGAVLSLISTNIAGHTKKTTVSALFFVGYCVGNIIGPQTFSASGAPQFLSAEITIMAMFAACIADMLAMYGLLHYRNKRKEEQRSRDAADRKGTEFLDLTDRENVRFVYSL